ncbi:alpha-amylase family glycosyl hydrolase [Micropruina sonneratiae]|uniref:alpha-amylase family glycosyl hydrolase n=1 Tax=Micropruina sonneratiae TaxID=2986940 RepID=UPI0022272014|nr:alpha-amylase family glycosyl hydrolase [Micropruina sp. KQZ13P-5]MCW3159070.1 alpha-amylase family glycosyl hydrolase [Micropruina sp. KQZ13P-5]
MPTTTQPTWWGDGVVYQVYPRSFADSDADGIGDFTGIRGRLPYLRDLGVDAVWLNPFYPSPQADQGYDVADYTGIEPDYGTLADFDAFLADAHELGLRVIIDIVANHCSSEHPLFRAALDAPAGSPARARFHFADGRGPAGERPPNNWRAMFGGPAWTRVADGQWYLHLFTPQQPDLNWRHPGTVAFFDDVLRVWLDRGVDGFRLDAAQGLFKHPDLPDADDPEIDERNGDALNPHAWNRPEVHTVYRHWRTIVDERERGDGVQRPLIGEVTGLGQLALPDYVGPDQLHQAFFFDFMVTPWDAAALRAVIERGLDLAATTGAPVTWVLGNHDMTRLATRMPGRALAATLLQLALPGAAYLYQGDELGLPEVLDLPPEARRDPLFRNTGGRRLGRDGCRVPIPWSGDRPPFGFSGTAGTWLPQPDWFTAHTVEAGLADPGSMLHAVRRALRLRRGLAGRPLRWLDAPPGVLAFERPAAVDAFRCVTNTTDEPVTLPDAGEPALASAPVTGGVLPGHCTTWWM